MPCARVKPRGAQTPLRWEAEVEMEQIKGMLEDPPVSDSSAAHLPLFCLLLNDLWFAADSDSVGWLPFYCCGIRVSHV